MRWDLALQTRRTLDGRRVQCRASRTGRRCLARTRTRTRTGCPQAQSARVFGIPGPRFDCFPSFDFGTESSSHDGQHGATHGTANADLSRFHSHASIAICSVGYRKARQHRYAPLYSFPLSYLIADTFLVIVGEMPTSPAEFTWWCGEVMPVEDHVKVVLLSSVSSHENSHLDKVR